MNHAKAKERIDAAIKYCLDSIKAFEPTPDIYREGLELMADTALVELATLDIREGKVSETKSEDTQ